MKKTLTISIVILLILAVGVSGYFIYKTLKQEPALSIFAYYDANGNEIVSGEQAVVGGVEGVKYITFKINAHNTDTTPLDINIVSATPDKLNMALSSVQQKTAEPDETVTWISGLVDIEEYEGTTQEFTVTLEASSPLRETAQKTSSVSVQIQPDPTSSFDIDITSETNNSADIPPEDNGGENPPQGTVYFRTTDLTYASSTAVGFSDVCGNVLTGYGRTSGACTDHSCDATDQDLDVISSSGTTKLWIRDIDNLCVCEDGATSGYSRRYSTDDADAVSVSTSTTSVDSTKEMFC